MGETVGAVKALWRFPVKSMRGEEVELVDLTERGLVGDRAYALVDTATGKVISGKTPRWRRTNFPRTARFCGHSPSRTGSR
jgi:uncharacterized protein YcbX